MNALRDQSSSKSGAGVTPVPGGVLQRKCACGSHSSSGGECDACRKNHHGLQRKTHGSGESQVPPIVHDVLRSPGSGLDAYTRAFFEPRFGRDLSGIRVHADPRAAESARAVDALAYTVGRDVVFGSGQYAPQTTAGRHLLAHEITHTLQQGAAATPASDLQIEAASSPAEREGEHTADAVMSGARVRVMPQAVSLARQKPVTPPVKTPPKAPAKTGTFTVSMTPFTTGVTGTIAFDPDPKNCPVCKLIRLVQIVRVFEKPGVDYPFPGAEAPREQVKTAADATKGVKANYFIDHLAGKCSKGNKCSLYYRDHAPNSTKSQDGSNDGATAAKASLWDQPSGDADDVFEFETCARCHDTSTYLRCVDWGFTADSAGKATLSASSEHAAPSATFNAAIAKFNTYYKNL